jgi:hypothetical protein
MQIDPSEFNIAGQYKDASPIPGAKMQHKME